MSHFDRIIFRADRDAYTQRDGRYPYIDHAAQAGASGVHIWFWGDDLRQVRDSFFDYCRGKNLNVHLGVGVGAYGVCDGEDPTDPETRIKIEEHIRLILAEWDVAGIEYQNGEYDRKEYRGASTEGKSHAQQVAEQLNPLVDFALSQRENLWIRTELNTRHFDETAIAEIASQLDRRCTVEWSSLTGPYSGPDAIEKGLNLLLADERASWFLKIQYGDTRHWEELAADLSREEIGRWMDHWRGWIRLLHEFNRRTLTICNVSTQFTEELLPIPAAAVALAQDPTLPNEEIFDRFF